MDANGVRAQSLPLIYNMALNKFVEKQREAQIKRHSTEI
jgi:hypothetical protein